MSKPNEWNAVCDKVVHRATWWGFMKVLLTLNTLNWSEIKFVPHTMKLNKDRKYHNDLASKYQICGGGG